MHSTLLAAGLAITLVVNIIAGYWRAFAKKTGSRLEWILAVHAPVPLVAILRRLAGVGFNTASLPALLAFIAAYFTGQRIGSYIYSIASRRLDTPTRFMIRDVLYLASMRRGLGAKPVAYRGGSTGSTSD